MHTPRLPHILAGFACLAGVIVICVPLRSRQEQLTAVVGANDSGMSSGGNGRQRQSGDFVLIHGYSPIGILVRWIQRRQFHGADRPFTYWDHAALLVSSTDIIEALWSGVARRHLSSYSPTQYVVVPIDATSAERRRIVAFAEHALGARYGLATTLQVALSAVTGHEIQLRAGDEQTCSSLVVRALQQGGMLTGAEPSHTVPADLARWWHVERPVPMAGAASPASGQLRALGIDE